jgi:hypothetical protein
MVDPAGTTTVTYNQRPMLTKTQATGAVTLAVACASMPLAVSAASNTPRAGDYLQLHDTSGEHQTDLTNHRTHNVRQSQLTSQPSISTDWHAFATIYPKSIV